VGIFFSNFALSFIAATLLVSGWGHALRPGSFGRVVRSHGVFPSWLITGLTIAVCFFELLVGTLAALSLRSAASFAARVAVLAAAAGAGVAFWVYLRRLLSDDPGAARTCGCSPLSAPLTKASLAPSISLVIVAIVGFAATAAIGADHIVSNLERALPCLWGVSLSGMTLLYPAAVLQFPARSDA
jgi:hypothetical protein